MPSVILPGFAFGRDTSRYRDLSTGKFVSRKSITDLLDSQTAKLEARLGNLATALSEGKLSPAYFAEQMRTELRRGHLQNRALGAGGWDKLTPADFGSVGRRLRDDYARIVNLAQGIKDGSVTLPQALNRVQGYSGSARLQFFEADAQARKEAAAGKGMALIMIRDLGASEHCSGCVSLYSQGWAFDLPLPADGSTECGTHCRCSVRYKEVASDDVAEWLNTRRG